MATPTGKDGKSVCTSNVDLLLHPELLSQEFTELLLNEKNISTRNCASRDRLTELYLRHVIPLPQRTLPDSRWGRRVRKTRGGETPALHSIDHNRKRPLIVFDGSSSHSGPLKVKKSEGATVSATGTNDQLKPPPAANLFNPIRRLSSNTSSSSSSINSSSDVANNSGPLKSPEVKKKIQHVTWP